MNSIIKSEFKQHLTTAEATIASLDRLIATTARLCIKSLENNGKILLFGNGGSAADAQHIAAELVGRYKLERRALNAIALTTDSSILTSISNDYSYEQVFTRQIQALANKNDVVIGISTSGTSANVVNALKTAKDLKCHIIGLSGNGGGKMNEICDVNLVIPAQDTPRIQEMHILIGHILCHLIDLSFRR